MKTAIPSSPPRLDASALPRAFYLGGAEVVARALLGATLVRRYRGTVRRARIVETEAYVGPHDLACHAAKGRTKRTETMFLPGGHAYVYLIYGMYDMLNVVTGARDDPQAVLIRAAEPLDGWHADLSGPGKLARALHITRAQDGADLTRGTLYIIAPHAAPRVGTSARIGVDYAKHWRDTPLRFFDPDSPAVSKHPHTARSRAGRGRA